MNHKGLIEQEVLHEIAMSIGVTLELNGMLRECLPIFVRGLGCCTAALLLHDDECGFFTPRSILPHAAMRNQGLHRAMAKAIDLFEAGASFPVPLCGEPEAHSYYAWPLKTYGILLLGRGNPLTYPLYREIGPLVEKLACAVQACQQYQSLELAQQAMSRARDEAESANKAKSHFLATISHEIRTPLNAVINLSELLFESQLDEKQQTLVRGICAGGSALLQLVNDVLDFSKIEAGKLDFVAVPFHLRSLLDGLQDLYGKQAQAKGLQFSLELSPLAPDVVETDPSRLRQVLQNLLTNAIKFTDQGFVRLVISKEVGSAAPLRFLVEDSGIGIATHEQEKLFTEFHQIDPGLNRRYGGTGLGLAIVARLVTLMGGAFGLDSALGVGSRFWFTLPLTEPQGEFVPSAPPVSVRFKGKVLLVEDSPTNQMVARNLLEKVGCEIWIAQSGEEAIQQVVQRPFDLILMDISMPGMDGLEATRAIRQLGGCYGQLPIVAMTAHALAQDRASCLNAGMNDYLTKPIRRPQLHEMLSRWLEPASPLGGAIDGVASAASSPMLLDEQALSALGSEITPEALQGIVELFTDELVRLQSQLAQAIHHSEWSSASAYAHAIKSSSGSLGAQALYQAASGLEQRCRQQDRAAAEIGLSALVGLVANTLHQLREAVILPDRI